MSQSESSPRVSVLLSVKDGAAVVSECIDSILAQTLQDFELVIVDDGSTDETPGILARYAAADPRLRVFTRENRGLTRALNHGLLACRAPLVARTDADDRSHPERLQRQVDYIDTHPDIVLLGTGCRTLGEDRTPTGEVSNPVDDVAIRRGLQSGNPLFHTSVMFRREVVAAIGGYDEDYRRAQDYELWLRLLDEGEGANLPEALVDYYMGSQRISRRASRAQAWCCARAKWKNRRVDVIRRASALRVLISLRTLVIPANTRRNLMERWRLARAARTHQS